MYKEQEYENQNQKKVNNNRHWKNKEMQMYNFSLVFYTLQKFDCFDWGEKLAFATIMLVLNVFVFILYENSFAVFEFCIILNDYYFDHALIITFENCLGL